MYHVSAQGVDERMINVHYYYYYFLVYAFLIRFLSADLNNRSPWSAPKKTGKTKQAAVLLLCLEKALRQLRRLQS